MSRWLSAARISLISICFFTVLLGLAYPLSLCLIGQIFFPTQANGTLFFYRNGEIIGSEWIAQNFTHPVYFHPRPSSAGNGYDAMNSSGSNLGPTSQKLFDMVQQRVLAYRSENRLSPGMPIPADAVTSSGSGLDPHISVANALLQAGRVAAARGWPEQQVRALVQRYTERPTWGIFGEARINVLRINLALDGETP